MALMNVHWRVEVALTTAPYATSDTWTDISSQVRALRWSDSRGVPGEAVNAKTATVTVDNRDGRWTASSTYASAPYAGNVRPDKRVRFSIRESSVASFVVMSILHLESVQTSDGPHDSTADLVCSDLFRLLAQAQPVAVSRPAELTGQRVVALLDAASVPAHLRSAIDNGTVMLAAADLQGQVLGLLHEVNRAEIGFFQIDASGRVVFLDRYQWIDDASLKSSQATIDEAEFLYGQVSSLSGSFNSTRIVTASGESGAAKAYTSTNFPANSPNTTRQELGLPVLYDGDVEAFAEATQKQHETVDVDESRPTGIRLHVASTGGINAGAMSAIVDAGTLPVTLLTYVSLTYRPIGWSADRDAQCRVEAVEHNVTTDQWETTLGFSAADSQWLAQEANHFYTLGSTLTADRRGAL